MVSISHESEQETERRLLRVIANAEIDHQEGAWTFRRVQGRTPSGAIAAVRDSDGWSALVPAPSDAVVRYGLTRFVFPPEPENSGFVGWLATIIKRHLGSGVFVVCGDNPARGGIFDYLGYPYELTSELRQLVAELALTRAGDPFNLDLRCFRISHAGERSIQCGMVLESREQGGLVRITSKDGSALAIIGRREGDRVASGFVALNPGQPQSGQAGWRIERTGDRGLRLVGTIEDVSGENEIILESIEAP